MVGLRESALSSGLSNTYVQWATVSPSDAMSATRSEGNGDATRDHTTCLIKSALIASALIPAIGLVANDAHADNLAPLDANDGTAKALGYVADASKGRHGCPSHVQGGPALRDLCSVPG